MKKVAFIFVLAVLLPSLVLAWLAVRSLRDQQFLLERQQSLLCQRVTDALAQNISDHLAQRQQEFSAQVESLAAGQDTRNLGNQFDSQLRQRWPFAEVGFCVTLAGKILSPAATARDEAKDFYRDNSAFLGNRETAEVYLSANNANGGNGGNGGNNFGSANSFNRNLLSGTPAPASSQKQEAASSDQMDVQRVFASKDNGFADAKKKCGATAGAKQLQLQGCPIAQGQPAKPGVSSSRPIHRCDPGRRTE